MTNEKYNVLILDDDVPLGELLKDFLQTATHCEVTIVTREEDFWECLAQQAAGGENLHPPAAYDILFLDYRLPETNGLDVLTRMRERGITIPTVMMTGEGSENVAARAIQYGAIDYLVKGQYSFTVLPPLIQKAVREREMQTAMQRYLEQIRYQATLLNNMRDAVVVWDMHGIITYWNSAAEQLYDCPASDRLGKSVSEVYFPAFDPPIPIDDLEHCAGYQSEHRYRQRSGSTIWISTHITPLTREGEQRPFGLMDVARDVTPRKLVEEKLQKRYSSEKLLSSISNRLLNLPRHEADQGIRDAILQTANFMDVSFGVILLLEDNQLVPYHLYRTQPGTRMNYFFPDIDLSRLDTPWLLQQLRGQQIVVVNSEQDLPDDTPGEHALLQRMAVVSSIFIPMIYNNNLYGMVVFGTSRPDFRWNEDHVYLLQTLSEMMTNAIIQKQVDHALRKSEARYRAIVEEHQTEMICRFRADATLTFANIAYCRYYGKERSLLIGSSFLEPVLLQDREQVQAKLAELSTSRTVNVFEQRVLLHNGELRYQEWTSRAIFDQHNDFIEFQAVGRDVTERKKMEEQIKTAQTHLAQAARLASIGELAAGVAHQISNPLTTIIADAQILMQKLDRSHPGRESAEAIVKAGWRTQQVINELMKFSQPSNREPEPVAINETIENALLLANAHLQASGIKFSIDLASDLPAVTGNPRQLTDLWVTLLLLARSASDDGKRHIVRIRTRKLSDDKVQIEVSDDGRPIPRSQHEKIFEPQLIPTGLGRGTGMELSICREIVRQNQGEISVFSSNNETVFRIVF